MSKALPLTRGAAIGVVSGLAIFATAMVVGFVDGQTGLLFFLGAGIAAIAGVMPPAPRNLHAAGAAIAAVVAVAGGLLTGFGWLEYSVIAGSALTAASGTLVTAHVLSHLGRLRWVWIVVPLLIIVFVVVPAIVDGGTLGHDESAYGLMARHWLEGTPETGWRPHRGIGMSVYGFFVLSLGGAEAGLRLIGLVGFLTLVFGVWRLGQRLANDVVGAMAAVGVVAGPEIMLRSTEYLSDIPSSALLVWCMVIVWREFGQQQQPTIRLLQALPLAWLSFYFRYQSALSLVLIALLVLILWWRKVRARPGPVMWTIGLGLLGLIPHALHALEVTGSPWGVMSFTSGVAIRAYVGEGLRDYGEQIWWDLSGYVGPIALGLAMVGAIAWWRDTGIKTKYVFLLAPAFLQVLVLGLISHGEPRFIFFPLALAIVAASLTLSRLIKKPRRAWAKALVLGIAILIVASLGLSASELRRRVDSRIASFEPVELAAREVATRAAGRPCGALTSFEPQFTFYSGCASRGFTSRLPPRELVDTLPGEVKYLVLIERGRRQPRDRKLDQLLTLAHGAEIPVIGQQRDAVVRELLDRGA